MKDGSGAKAIFSILGTAAAILLLAFTLSGEARGISDTQIKLNVDSAKHNIRSEGKAFEHRVWDEFGKVNTKIDSLGGRMESKMDSNQREIIRLLQ